MKFSKDWISIFDDCYRINVKQHPIVTVRGNNVRGNRSYPGRPVKVRVNKDGYEIVDLFVMGNKVAVSVHVLVALVVLGPCPPGKEVNHRDLDKRNNRPSNLEYLTHLANIRHAAVRGVWSGAKPYLRGPRMSSRVVSPELATRIKKSYRLGKLNQHQLADKFGVCRSLVSDVLNNKAKLRGVL